MIKKYRPNTYFRTHKRVLENTFQKTETKYCNRNGKFFQWCWYSKTIWKSSKTFRGRFKRKEFIQFSKKHANDKSPGTDGLTNEFYETFWNELKELFVESLSEAKEKGHLSTSQKQAIIKLIEKKIEIANSFKTVDPFFVEHRSKNNIKSSFWENKKSSNRFDILTANSIC